jgi:hypothetical protein
MQKQIQEFPQMENTKRRLFAKNNFGIIGIIIGMSILASIPLGIFFPFEVVYLGGSRYCKYLVIQRQAA